MAALVVFLFFGLLTLVALAEDEDEAPFTVLVFLVSFTESAVGSFLGRPRFFLVVASEAAATGASTGVESLILRGRPRRFGAGDSSTESFAVAIIRATLRGLGMSFVTMFLPAVVLVDVVKP